MANQCKGIGIDYKRPDGETIRYFTKKECDKVGGNWAGNMYNGRGECLATNENSPQWSLVCVGSDPNLLAPNIEGVKPGGPLDTLFSFFGGTGDDMDYSKLMLPAVGLAVLFFYLRKK